MNENFAFYPLSNTLCTSSCYRQDEKMLPFIHTDLLIQYAHEEQQPILHFWTLEKTLVLGMKDLRVPHFNQAVSFLEQHAINTVVRNAGGLAVALDHNVLNISLIFPSGNQQGLSIESAYEQFYQWFRQTFNVYGLQLTAGEIAHSYCPGTFDFSIAGKKVAGTAQRRLKDATAVMAYIGIDGNQQKRGELVRQFYQKGLGSQFGTNGYPPVDPDSMATLNELSAHSFDLTTLQQVLKKEFSKCFQSQLTMCPLDSLLSEKAYATKLPQLLERMKKRNEPLQINL